MAGRIVIVGGGAVGSAVAYWLTADPALDREVVVVERDPAYRQASSALSASAIRQQFSTPVNIAIQREHGADVALLDPAALAERFPWLSTEGLAGASLGLSGEGWFDGYALLRALRAKALAQGTRYLAAEATGLAVEGGRVRSLRLGDGSGLACDAL